MYYDLNVPYVPNQTELQQTLTFLSELGYDTIALNHSISGKVPAEISNQLPCPLPFKVPPKLRVLRRCTLHLSDPNQNHRLSQISAAYDIFALRPTTEKALQQACHSLDCDLISLDFSVRHPYYFQIKTMKSALDRGVKFEVCYAPGILDADGGTSRRNLISNATQLIRATRGRGIVISSEASKALACRGPADVINLAVMWGLHQERGVEAVGREARSVVAQAEMKRRSFKGVVDIVFPGAELARRPIVEKMKKDKGKRKAAALDDAPDVMDISPKPMSKREQKRLAKKAKHEDLNPEGLKVPENRIGLAVDEGSSQATPFTNGEAG